MKKRIVHGLILIFLLSGLFTLPAGESASAVTDSCSGVATSFTVTAPTSVVTGQSFTLSNITTQPSTSYGVTVTSAVLSLSASNASPTSYSQNDSSTVPSPTTGAANYIAYYPNWSLTASGSAGSVVTVNLVSVVAQVNGIGSVTCDLSSTLATIKVTAPASTGGSSSSPGTSSGSSSTKSSSGAPSTSATTNTPALTTSTPTITTTKTVKSTAGKQAVTIVVENSQNRAVEGAGVSIDNLPVVYTNARGNASFKNVSQGDHQVSVAFNKQKAVSTVQINPKNTSYVVPIKTAATTHMKGNIALSIAVLAVICLAVFLLLRKRRSIVATPVLSPVAISPPSDGQNLQSSLPLSPNTIAEPQPQTNDEPTAQQEQPQEIPSIPVAQPPSTPVFKSVPPVTPLPQPQADPNLPDSPDPSPPEITSQSGS